MSAPPARIVYFITHPNVVIDPGVTITEWPLSPLGRMRMVKACVCPWVPALSALYSSAERKALDGAEILSAAIGLPVSVRADLGENDRSATGYLPPAEFEGLADRFFAEPERSIRGWGRAVDEQARIVGAIDAVIAEAPGKGVSPWSRTERSARSCWPNCWARRSAGGSTSRAAAAATSLRSTPSPAPCCTRGGRSTGNVLRCHTGVTAS